MVLLSHPRARRCGHRPLGGDQLRNAARWCPLGCHRGAHASLCGVEATPRDRRHKTRRIPATAWRIDGRSVTNPGTRTAHSTTRLGLRSRPHPAALGVWRPRGEPKGA